MTVYSVHKCIYVVAAGFAMLALGGCDRAGGVLSQTLQEIKTVPVDANDRSVGTAADKKLNAKDVALLVNTAKALTVGHDGVLSQTDGKPKLQIAVVNPLDMPRQSDDVLDERLHNVAPDPNAVMATAAHDLPDIPIHDGEAPEAPLPRSANDTPWHAVTAAVGREVAPLQSAVRRIEPALAGNTAPKAATRPDAGRSIQIGSFGSLGAAQSALAALRDAHPAVHDYSASFEKVTTAAGKAMVRLKLGPVDNDSQAQRLCGQLDIRDSWCHRAG